jgi:beta-glucosidase
MTEPTLTSLRPLVEALSLEDKVRLVTGASFWYTAEEPTIGLSSVCVSDGPVGVRGPVFDERRVAASFPSPTCLGASFDDDLVQRVATAMAGEAARQGAQVVLGPTINLHRSPLGGRHFECFSEDPHLTGRLATAYVRGLQDNGVGACPKHFVANDAETDRFTVDNLVDERTLRELYLTPFEAVVCDASPWTVMSAYNGVNGAPMSENALLDEPLKGEWGWDGLVMSDWGGVYSTVESARAAVDLAMPGPEAKWGEPLLEAVRAGEVDESALDDKLVRLLLLAARVGKLAEHSRSGPTPVATEAIDAGPLAREAAAAGTVLLRNDGTLPLDPKWLRRLALIGPSALEPRHQGGGSAMVFTPYVVRPHEALAVALGEHVEIVTAKGADLRDALRAPFPEEVEGTTVRWLSAEGDVLAEQPAPTSWVTRGASALHPGAASLEIRTRFLPPASGTWRLGVSGPGSFELELDGRLAVKDTFDGGRLGMDGLDDLVLAGSVPVELTAGTPVDVVLRYRWPEQFLLFSSGFGVQQVLGTEDEMIADAVEVARAADVAIVVVGTSELVESEGRDRAHLRLPGRQDDLVAAVAAANPRTVVVVNAGAPVEMPWRDDVAALLITWFPGMECGNALADVLVGTVEPGGRLPTTWPAEIDQAPVVTTTPQDGVVRYDEGLEIGHRAYLRRGTSPAFWFGQGLGYTTWEYEGLDATAEHAHVTLRNTGTRPGKQVVQVYASRPGSALERPAQVLAGYAVVRAEPGETVEVEVPVDPRTLRHWDVETRTWQVEPGELVLRTGPHAGDLPLAAHVQLATP